MKQLDDEQVKKEKLLFLALCSERDREYINLEADLTAGDFERIVYLLCALGFQNFLLEFEREHKDLLSQIGQQITRRLEMRSDTDREMEKADSWLREFCNGFSDPIMRYYMEILFHLDKGE